MIFKFGKIEIWRTFLVGVPIHPAVPIHSDLRYSQFICAVYGKKYISVNVTCMQNLKWQTRLHLFMNFFHAKKNVVIFIKKTKYYMHRFSRWEQESCVSFFKNVQLLKNFLHYFTFFYIQIDNFKLSIHSHLNTKQYGTVSKLQENCVLTGFGKISYNVQIFFSWNSTKSCNHTILFL